MVPGAPMDDAPVQVDGQEAWLLDQVGKGFQVMCFVDAPPTPEVLAQLAGLQVFSALFRANAQPIHPAALLVASCPMDIPGVKVVVDVLGLVAKRYDATSGTTYLLRPDQHVVARWRQLDTSQVQAALTRALGGHMVQI